MEWWKKPLRVADFSLEGPIREEAIPEIVGRKKDLNFNAEHVCVFDYEGGERGVFYFLSEAAESVPFDFLTPYLRESHREGLKVFIYFNVHWINGSYGVKHVDWLQRKRDGSIIDDVYGMGMSPCVNSPGYRSWSFQVVRDLARYEIEGIFLDGPIFIPSGCWCAACGERFGKAFGEGLPQQEDWEDQTWKNFIEFRYRSITSYMEDARKALKEVRPGAAIYMNGQGLWPSWPNGRDNRRLSRHQEIIGAEGGFIGGDLRKVSLWKPSMTAKLLETQADGKPTTVFIAGKNCSWDKYALSAVETKLIFAQTVAHGASPWYGMYFNNSTSDGARAAGEMNAFIEENTGYLSGGVSLAKTAVMWSIRTADYYRATVPVTDFTQNGEKLTRQTRVGDHYNAFTGCFESLMRSHIQFDVLDEMGVEAKLGAYKVLILPNAACLSDDLAAAIETWIKDGGTLVASFETSFYDEWGGKRKRPCLADALGITSVGIEGPCNLDYFDRGSDPIFNDVRSTFIPSPRYRVLVDTASSRAEPLAYYREKYPARYQPLPELSDHPAILRNRHGRGTVVYFAGNIAEHYLEFHCPEHNQIMTSPVREAAEPLVITDAPGSVEIVLRYQPGQKRVLVHLINLTVEMTRPISRSIVLRDIEISLPFVKDLEKSYLLNSRHRVVFETSGGFRTTVPLLEVHDVLVLEDVVFGDVRRTDCSAGRP